MPTRRCDLAACRQHVHRMLHNLSNSTLDIVQELVRPVPMDDKEQLPSVGILTPSVLKSFVEGIGVTSLRVALSTTMTLLTQLLSLCANSDESVRQPDVLSSNKLLLGSILYQFLLEESLMHSMMVPSSSPEEHRKHQVVHAVVLDTALAWFDQVGRHRVRTSSELLKMLALMLAVHVKCGDEELSNFVQRSCRGDITFRDLTSGRLSVGGRPKISGPISESSSVSTPRIILKSSSEGSAIRVITLNAPTTTLKTSSSGWKPKTRRPPEMQQPS